MCMHAIKVYKPGRFDYEDDFKHLNRFDKRERGVVK